MCTTALPWAPSPAKGGPANQSAPPGGWYPPVAEVRGWKYGDLRSGHGARSRLGAEVPAGVRVCALRPRWLPRGHRGHGGHQGLMELDMRGRVDCRMGSPGCWPGRSDNTLTWLHSPPQVTLRRAPGGGGAADPGGGGVVRGEGSVSPVWAPRAWGSRDPRSRASLRPESQFSPLNPRGPGGKEDAWGGPRGELESWKGGGRLRGARVWCRNPRFTHCRPPVTQ